MCHSICVWIFCSIVAVYHHTTSSACLVAEQKKAMDNGCIGKKVAKDGIAYERGKKCVGECGSAGGKANWNKKIKEM